MCIEKNGNIAVNEYNFKKRHKTQSNMQAASQVKI
jgi:hypothetical protein